MTTMTQTKVKVIGGVDTHGDVHVAAAIDEIGRVLGTASFATTAGPGTASCSPGSATTVSSIESVSKAPVRGCWPVPLSQRPWRE